MSDQQPANGQRLDRIERALDHLISVQASRDARLGQLVDRHVGLDAAQELLASSQKQLLRAQVLLTDTVEAAHAKLIALGQETDRRLRELAEAQQHTDANLNALIGVVDGLVRNRPQP